MENIIQNIFMDQKSYESIQEKSNIRDVIETVLERVETDKTQPQKVTVEGIEFEAEFHPKNDYFGFTYTKEGYHCICYEKNKFRNSIYLYSKTAMKEYEKDFPGATLLLYTTKKAIYVIPHGSNGLSKMDTSSGKYFN